MTRSRVRPLLFIVLLIPCLARTQDKPPQQTTGTVIEIPPPGKTTTSRPVNITFERINLGPNVNSQYSELFPVLSSDETIMFFTRKGDPSNAGYAKNPNDED